MPWAMFPQSPVLILGMGCNVIGRAVDALFSPSTPIHVLEIEPAVVELCREQGALSSPNGASRFQCHIGDVRSSLSAMPRDCSLIFLDCYDPLASSMMHAQELIASCRSHLRDDGGVLVVNAHVLQVDAKAMKPFVKGFFREDRDADDDGLFGRHGDETRSAGGDGTAAARAAAASSLHVLQIERQILVVGFLHTHQKAKKTSQRHSSKSAADGGETTGATASLQDQLRDVLSSFSHLHADSAMATAMGQATSRARGAMALVDPASYAIKEVLMVRGRQVVVWTCDDVQLLEMAPPVAV